MTKKPYYSRINEKLEEYRDDDDLSVLSTGIDDEEKVEDFFINAEAIQKQLRGEIPISSTVARAFKEANFDPSFPFHWWLLLQAFTDTHYKNKKGGRLIHTPERNRQLFDDIRSEIESGQATSIMTACENLVRRAGSRYADADAKYWSEVAKSQGITRAKLDENEPPPFWG